MVSAQYRHGVEVQGRSDDQRGCRADVILHRGAAGVGVEVRFPAIRAPSGRTSTVHRSTGRPDRRGRTSPRCGHGARVGDRGRVPCPGRSHGAHRLLSKRALSIVEAKRGGGNWRARRSRRRRVSTTTSPAAPRATLRRLPLADWTGSLPGNNFRTATSLSKGRERAVRRVRRRRGRPHRNRSTCTRNDR